MDEHVYPNEREVEEALDHEVDADTAFPAILVDLRERARAEGLWNLFLPDREDLGPGLTNGEYGVLCEEMGRAPGAPPSVSTRSRRTRATWRSWPSTPAACSAPAGWSRCWTAAS